MFVDKSSASGEENREKNTTYACREQYFSVFLESTNESRKMARRPFEILLHN
jgi:hypothetical protein